MCTEYKYYKKEINKKEIDELEIYFDNGDCFKIKKYEIKDYNISLSDKLLWIENTIHRAVAKGVVKLKIAETKVAKYQDAQVFNMKEFIKDRKGVMERRCLDGGIAFITLINKYNNCFRLYGDIIAKVQDGYLIIEFLESEKYPNNNPYSSIMLDNLDRVRHFISDELENKYELLLKEYRDNNFKKMYDELNVKDTKIISIDIIEDKAIIKVKLISRYMDYFVDRNTLEFVSGVNDRRVEKINYLVFEKRLGTKYGSIVRKCQSCGASIDVNSDGKCKYCRSIYNVEERDWILTNIEVIED